MTTLRFDNAPLLEVMAELRWNTAQDAIVSQTLPGIPLDFSPHTTNATEALILRLAERLEGHEFRNSERLVPYGAPLSPGQSVVRFRRRVGTPPVLQIGAGVFSVNGLPPTYTHWGDFEPVLRMGVESLIESRAPEESDIPFSTTVRYVDAFGPEYWAEMGSGKFITDVLGFGPSLPGVVSQVDEARQHTAAHQLVLPLEGDASLLVSVGEGFTDSSEAVILEVLVKKENVGANLEDVLTRFRESHAYIRELFVRMTHEVHHIMRPIEVASP